MITRDYLLRQIHQMAQVLARVLFLKSGQQHEQALQVIDETFQNLPGLDVLLDSLLTRNELLALCRTGDEFHSEKALALADLLAERASLVPDSHERIKGYRYSLWLYEAAAAEGGSIVPLDVHARIARLRERIGAGSDDEATET